VLNGSGRAGVASAALTSLQKLGFVAAGKATNADRSDYIVTEVRYAPGAQAKGQLVLSKLGGAGKLVALSSRVGNADVVVVLGGDFTAVHAPATSAGGAGTSKPHTTTAPPAPVRVGCS
jgi:hypothetical protein